MLNEGLTEFKLLWELGYLTKSILQKTTQQSTGYTLLFTWPGIGRTVVRFLWATVEYVRDWITINNA